MDPFTKKLLDEGFDPKLDEPVPPAVEAETFAWLRARGVTAETIRGTPEERQRYAKWLAANP